MEASAAKITPMASSMSASGSTNSPSSEKMNYALQVALQTIKERCIQLQRRVASMEEENQQLREASSRSEGAPRANEIGVTGDVLSLKAQVSELQRQKEQLEEHIGMVSNENRRLWSRLSQISKDQQLNALPSSTDSRAQQNQNLVRSKTFTQHSPNPHLRQKMLSDGIKDLSLEEIALDDFGASREELGYPYNLQKVEETTSEPDANVDAKRCLDGLQELRREAMKQQQELRSVMTLLENRIGKQQNGIHAIKKITFNACFMCKQHSSPVRNVPRKPSKNRRWPTKVWKRTTA